MNDVNNSLVMVIVLNYNQEKYTISCVHSLLKSTYKNFIIFLLDNGSEYDSYLSLEETLENNDRVILQRIENNIGYRGGINYCLKEGSKLNPMFFLIMNNDTIIDEHAIDELVNTINIYGNQAIVTGKVYHYDQPNLLQDIGYTFKNEQRLLFNRIGLNEIDSGQYDFITERAMLDDVFWLVPKKLYETIGGYSDFFWFNSEQADFALRARNENYKLIFTPYAKIWHKGSVSIGGRENNPSLVYWNIQGTLIFRYLHLSSLRFIQFFLNILLSIILTYSKAFLTLFGLNGKSFKYANAKFYGLMYFIKWMFIKNVNTGYNPFNK